MTTKRRLHKQTLNQIGRKEFAVLHPMNHKKGIIMLFAPCDVFLDVVDESEYIELATEVTKYLAIDYHFSENNFLQHISEEFEKVFKKITAQNTINKYALFSFINFLILQEGMASPEANKTRELYGNLKKDTFVYDKLNLSEREVNSKLSTALRKILKRAMEISEIKF